jgi:hypothetical protein
MVMSTSTVSEWLASNIFRSRVERAKKSVEEHGWTHSYEGMAVSKEMKEFLFEVQKAMPHVKFIASNDAVETDPQTGKRQHVMSYFLVTMDDCPYEIGRIGFGDFSANRNGNSTYVVYSRKIQNSKFREGRDQFNMVMTSDVKKAITNVKKYLVPFSTKELATYSCDSIASMASMALKHARDQMTNTLNPINYAKELWIKELLNLKSQGVTFVTHEFHDIMKVLPERVDIYNEEKDKKVYGLFVRLYNIGEDTYLDVQRVNDLRGASVSFAPDMQTFSMSSAPQDILGGVATLAILEPKQYVTNVGMKVDEKHYWIERSE